MRQLILSFLLLISTPVISATTDWGIIPLDAPTTETVSGIDITKNFTDYYNFTIAGGTDANYSVLVEFDFCKNGCGNPAVSYGLYDMNGGLISDSGSAVLTAGLYSFQVKATGMGSGNTLDYNGTITFVSNAPEPSDYMLFFIGISGFYMLYKLRKQRTLDFD